MTADTIKTSDPESVLRKTISLLDTPKAPEMLAPVEQALRQAPKDFRLWHVHGLILRQLDRRELAIPSLERSLQLAPTSPLVAHGLARTLFEAGLPSTDAY